MTVLITLIGKPGCHLCDEAHVVIEEVRGVLATDGIETSLTELNILEDAQLARLHSEDIPVVMIGSKRHAIWRVDRERFTAAILKAAKRPKFSLRKS